jgi:uncharacterized protein (TIGR00369 family)
MTAKKIEQHATRVDTTIKPAAPPTGFKLAPLNEGFLNLVGPIYARAEKNRTLTLALRATAAHANRYGLVHGGLLATLADVAIGMNLARVTETVETTLTLNLSLDFVSSAKDGEWIETRVTLSKESGRVRFGECRVQVGEKLIVRGSAVFYVPDNRIA